LPTCELKDYITAHEALHDLAALSEDESINHVWSKAARSPEQGDRRLLRDRPGYTIRAECHGNIQWHYDQPRRISMREAARIQSFPDTFIFESKLRETERQIGNAVPPVLAWHIAKAVAASLK
jgi:DNA (cytosine-5)-methyltransferase 1